MISENSLEDLRWWFYLDEWTVQQALMLFCGADPNGPSGPYPPMRPIKYFEDQFDPSDAYDKYAEYERRWRSGDHSVECYRPGYFLDWAKIHGVTVPLAGNIEFDLLSDNRSQEIDTQSARDVVAARTRNKKSLEQGGTEVASNDPSRREKSLMRIVAALLDYIEGNLAEIEKHPSFVDTTTLIKLLDEKYDGFEGLSKSNLSRLFPAAKKLLE